jgi:TPR repeat protein
MLGISCEYGIGVEKDMKKAVDYYQRGVDNEDSECMLKLARLYFDDQAENDTRKGIEMLKQAAELGNPKAMNELGVHYQRGDCVEVDSVQAAKLFEKAAELGLVIGMLNWGDCLSNGLGCPRNREEANEWHGFARQHGQENEYQLPQDRFHFTYVSTDGLFSVEVFYSCD